MKVFTRARLERPRLTATHRRTMVRRMSDEDLKAELERLKAENAALKARGSRGVSMKVSDKGGVSVYGLGRFPVTLYKEQWAKLLDLADDLRAFIKENDAKLKTKDT
jgi:hypothetical protein